jgi:hypothetical protein
MGATGKLTIRRAEASSMCSDEHPSPNKPMQRAVTHEAPGGGRSIVLMFQVPRARVLTGQPSDSNASRWAT